MKAFWKCSLLLLEVALEISSAVLAYFSLILWLHRTHLPIDPIPPFPLPLSPTPRCAMLLPWAAHRLGDAVDCSLWFQTCTRLFDRISEWTRKTKHAAVAMPLLTGARVCQSVSLHVCMPVSVCLCEFDFSFYANITHNFSVFSFRQTVFQIGLPCACFFFVFSIVYPAPCCHPPPQSSSVRASASSFSVTTAR